MLDAEKRLVQTSWQKASSDKELFIETLYANFFEMSPRSRLLFKRDLKLHQRSIVAMLGSTIERLDTLELVMPELIPSGARHKDYRVTQDDFELFRIALLDTLKFFLAQDYTEDLEDAWNTVYRFIASTMCSAMRITPGQLTFDVDSFSRP